MKRIAITSESPNLDDPVEPRFGRAAGFIVIEPESGRMEYLDNGLAQTLSRGAGIQAAETLVKVGAKVLLTGYVGPKAFEVLSAAGVTVVQNVENMSARQALEAYLQGNFKATGRPLARGHGR